MLSLGACSHPDATTTLSIADAGPHHLDLTASSVWPHVAKINCKFVLIEGANARHEHEAAAYAEAIAKGLIDPTKLVIVPGVIDTSAARVEHPTLIAERLLRFVRAAGHPSRVMASTDNSFATDKRSVITADLAWRKMGALVEGAALASRLYMQVRAHATARLLSPSLAFSRAFHSLPYLSLIFHVLSVPSHRIPSPSTPFPRRLRHPCP